MPFMNINSELITMTRRCDHFREPFRFRYLDFCNTSAGRFVLKDFEACISYFPPWLQCVQRVISHSVRYTMRVISCYTSFGCVEWAVSWPHAAFGPPRYLSQLSLRWVYRIYYGVFCPRLPARCVLSPMSVKGKPQVIEIGQGFRRGTWRRRRDVVTLEWVGSSVVYTLPFWLTARPRQGRRVPEENCTDRSLKSWRVLSVCQKSIGHILLAQGEAKCELCTTNSGSW